MGTFGPPTHQIASDLDGRQSVVSAHSGGALGGEREPGHLLQYLPTWIDTYLDRHYTRYTVLYLMKAPPALSQTSQTCPSPASLETGKLHHTSSTTCIRPRLDPFSYCVYYSTHPTYAHRGSRIAGRGASVSSLCKGPARRHQNSGRRLSPFRICICSLAPLEDQLVRLHCSAIS